MRPYFFYLIVFKGCYLDIKSINGQGPFRITDSMFCNEKKKNYLSSLENDGFFPGLLPIKVTGVLVVPVRGLNLWIGTRW